MRLVEPSIIRRMPAPGFWPRVVRRKGAVCTPYSATRQSIDVIPTSRETLEKAGTLPDFYFYKQRITF